MSSQKDFNFKLSSVDNYGSITTDSSIKLFKNRYKTKSGKKKTKYYVKIGREIYQFKNRDLNIKHFTPKTANISRKNGKYYISLSGYQNISKKVIDSSKNIGIDVNFETIVGSDGFKVQLKNLPKGKIIIEIEPAYTSKTCNNCKEINSKLKFEREWTCPSCNTKLDRDLNAARNIQELGMMQFQSGTRL